MQKTGYKQMGQIGLFDKEANLLYNMCRYEQIVRLNLLPIKKLT